MNKIFKRSYWLYAFAIAFFSGIVTLFFTMQIHASEWVVKDYNKHLYSGGEFLAAGKVTDRTGTKMNR